jgi:hypothetical protein
VRLNYHGCLKVKVTSFIGDEGRMPCDCNIYDGKIIISRMNTGMVLIFINVV